MIHTDRIILLVHHYGYFGLTGVLILGIVGLPLPDETILTAVGYLVFKGHLSYFPALFAGILGGAVGITVSYLAGVMLGRPAVLRIGRFIHLGESRMVTIERYFDKYGTMTLIVGFFIPGVRHITAIVAGVGAMRYPRFALAAYTGVCIWITTFITLGRFAGPHIAGIRKQGVSPWLWMIVALTVALVAGMWIFRGVRQYRHKRR